MSLKELIDAYEAVYATSGQERPEPFNVEDVFDKFVATCGGVKVSTMIQERSKMQQNADYFFKEDNCIIELKTIDGIYSVDAGVKPLHQAFIDAGCGDLMFPVMLGELDIPEAVRKKILIRTKRSFEDRVKKAKSQIHQSKIDFGNKDTFGLVLIAMNSQPIFGQFFMLQTLASMMDRHFGYDDVLDGMIYINPNIPSKPNATGMEYGGWFPLYSKKSPDDRLVDFVDTIGSRWLEFAGRKIGIINPILKFDANEVIDMRYLLNGQS